MSGHSHDEAELRPLLEAIYIEHGHDFRSYARPTLVRRLSRALERFECRSFEDLRERVVREPAVFDELFSLLSIRVSELFRDPPFFHALRTSVAPVLATYPTLKVWIAGCASGEEVYSLAILLAEEGLLDRTLVYATDIHAGALAQARAGIYPLARVADFSAAYHGAGGSGSLSDHYVAGREHIVFDRALRANVVFADHSLATDGAFAEVELVLCRNVLIYFDLELQARALGVIHDSLAPQGFLGLGARESLRASPERARFVPLREDQRIYRRA